MKFQKNYILLVVATVFWGANFIFAKLALRSMEPSLIATFRFLIASLTVMLFFVLKQGSLNWRAVKKKLGILSVSGLIGVFIYNLMMFVGLKTTSSTNGALIMGLNPMFTLLFSVFLLKSKINRYQILGIVISFCGVLFIISGGHLNVLLNLKFVSGDVLLIISSMVFGLYNVINKKYLTGLDALNLTAFTTFPAALMFLVYTLSRPDRFVFHFEMMAIVAVVFMGIFGSVLAYYFWNRAVKELGADASAVFINLVPFFAAIMSLFIGQSISIIQLLGGTFVIGGVYVSTRFKSTI